MLILEVYRKLHNIRKKLGGGRIVLCSINRPGIDGAQAGAKLERLPCNSPYRKHRGPVTASMLPIRSQAWETCRSRWHVYMFWGFCVSPDRLPTRPSPFGATTVRECPSRNETAQLA